MLAVIISVITGAYALKKIRSVAQAYVYGYPLVLIDHTRTTFLQADSDSKPNQFKHIQWFPDHNFRSVVRPNNDTLYSIAWLDLSLEPQILTVPNTNGRYYVMPFMDAWSNVFSMIGKRTTGTREGHYAVTGPLWDGPLPNGVIQVKSPTNMVWLIGRIQTNGVQDIDQVMTIQDRLLLTSLGKWGTSTILDNPETKYDRPESKLNQTVDDPAATVNALDANQFFTRLARLIAEQPGPSSDAQAIDNLSELGVKAGQSFKPLSSLDQWLFDKAIRMTQDKLDQQIRNAAASENGWRVHRSTIGNYGTEYTFRTAVAKIGLGALPIEEAVYPTGKVDSNGDPLSGNNKYKIHFKKDLTPPVNAFWSLSMYDEEGFFVDNQIKRYSIGDRDLLQYNDDGSLDIYIQSRAPTSGKSNWLPSPNSNFVLTMRLYSPKQSFINGHWKLPKIERLDAY